MDQYEYALAAAYVRGAAQNHGEILPDALVRKDLADLTQESAGCSKCSCATGKAVCDPIRPIQA